MRCEFVSTSLFPTFRQDVDLRVRDLLTSILSDVCPNVSVEPPLQPRDDEQLLPGSDTTENARVDIGAQDFWQRGQGALFDVRVFNLCAPTNEA